MALDRRRERAYDDLEGDEEEDDRSHRPRLQSSVITILEAFVIERTGGVDEARNMIQSIIDCGDTRHYQVQLRNSAECLMFKATTKKVSKKASEMLAKAKAKGGFPDALVKVGPILYTFARHFIVKKTIVNPSISFGAIIMAMMRYVCNKRRIISPQWFQLFQGKVWDSLQRFCTAVKFDRLTFFYQVISSNGDQLVCGAMESFSILHKTQPLIGRSAAIGNPEKRKMFSISKQFYEDPEQVMNGIRLSLDSDHTVHWMEQFFDDVHMCVEEVTNKLELLVPALLDAKRAFLEESGRLQLLQGNEKVHEKLQQIICVGDIPSRLTTGLPEFNLRIVASRVQKTIQLWDELKVVVEKASPNSSDSKQKLSKAQKDSFTNHPAIQLLFGNETNQSLLEDTMDAFMDLNKKMWSSEFHILFLGFRAQYSGPLQIDLWKGIKADDHAGPTRVFHKSHAEFFQIFTPQYVGSIYKLMSYFLFHRPISTTLKAKDMLDKLTDGDTLQYVELAKYQMKRAFTNNQWLDRNFNYLRMFCKAYHEDWLEEENLAVSSGTITDLGGLMQSYDDISDGDEF